MTPIILLHGAIGASDQLEPLKQELEAKGCTVYTFNFSGHGRTAFRQTFGIDAFARELVHFIQHHKLQNPDIFGYSMGGYVALYTASKHPGFIGRIATLGTKFKWDPGTAQKEIKMLDANTIEQKVPKFAETLRNRHGEDWKVLLQKTAEMMVSLGDSPLLSDHVLTSIENKICVGLADQDNMVGLEETLHVRSQLKQASMYMLPSTKHPIESVHAGTLSTILLNIFN